MDSDDALERGQEELPHVRGQGQQLRGATLRPRCDPQKSPDKPGSPEGNTEGPGTASSEPLLLS